MKNISFAWSPVGNREYQALTYFCLLSSGVPVVKILVPPQHLSEEVPEET